MPKPFRCVTLVIGFMCVAVLFTPGGLFSSLEILAKTQTVGSAEDNMNTAKEFYNKGIYGEAALQWAEAAKSYEKEGNLHGQAQALMYLGQSLKQMGQMNNAIMTLEVARDLAKQGKDKPLMVRILGSLGNANFLLGREKKAIDYLTQGLEMARVEGLSVQTAVLLNDLGNVQFALKKQNSALEAYVESALLAETTGNDTLSVLALINAVMAEIKSDLYQNARERLELAFSKIQVIRDSHDKTQGLLKIGLAYEDLRTSLLKKVLPSTKLMAQSHAASQIGKQSSFVDPEDLKDESHEEMGEAESVTSVKKMKLKELLNKTVMAFQQAINLAKRVGDHRAESYGYGYLGHVWETELHMEKALTYTRQALHIGQKISAPELVYRWQWQIARVYRKVHEDDKAITAYQLALNTLNPIRQELVGGYQGRRPPFRIGTGSLFFEFTDLLLQKASMLHTTQETEGYLKHAQKILEDFNAAELQDYFQDQCVKTVRTQSLTLENVPKTKDTAVIYPIILRERLELLVLLPDGGLKTYRLRVKEQILTREIREFRDSLEEGMQTSNVTQSHAQQLYDWLIRPVYDDLIAASIDVLVFVPDGPLWTIPFGPLHDRVRNQFLVDQFALAITPGISLTDFRPMDRTNVNVLGLGLSETIRGYQALPWVTHEMEAIKALFPSKILLNKEFQVSSMDRELNTQKYNVVHIATHGKVQPRVKDSFIQAFDQKITMDHLSEMIGVFKFGAQPLELLTLSACETATGDDRAALGLAGIAIKAGAKSALASLWPIDDEATSILASEFYQQLSNDPIITKAVALQRAQQSLKSLSKFQHPRYWSPFLLIGNWL